jgi:hypothetical protein
VGQGLRDALEVWGLRPEWLALHHGIEIPAASAI